MQQRHCLILQGTENGLRQQADTFYQQVPAEQRVWVSAQADKTYGTVAVKQVQQLLGQEFSLLVFEASKEFSTDAFAALIGTLRAGGSLLILLNETLIDSAWLQRFISIANQYPVQWFRVGESLPKLAGVVKQSAELSATEEQQLAILAINKVVNGHRRRPLVISSDRGRGKTTLLGMAAAELLRSGKQKIVVTAPQFTNVEILFRTVQTVLEGAEYQHLALRWQNKILQFIAVDALLETLPVTDLLIVDEAAAIPIQMLEQMLRHYSRLVFASTVHGYEGTGRGFALRFHRLLDEQTPGWRLLTLSKPIRWAENDWLEQFSFDALLLNAEPVTEEVALAAYTKQAQCGWIEQRELVNNDGLLKQIFGLMVQAHYRTRPSDLQMLLDRDEVRIAVLRHESVILASAWLVDEPEMNDELAEAVFNGERRLKGQLIPQSLLVHCGITDAGRYRYQRIIRIAVHPVLQNLGIGSDMLSAMASELATEADVLGTSFALDEQLLPFWLKNNFIPVRVGSHADHVSGSRSILMLRALTETGAGLVERAKALFAKQWPLMLTRHYRQLSVELIVLISAIFHCSEKVTDIKADITAFAYTQRPYEACEIALFHWLSTRLGCPTLLQLPSQQQSILIRLIMQNHSFAEVAKEMGFTGKTQLIFALREAVAAYIEATDKSV